MGICSWKPTKIHQFRVAPKLQAFRLSYVPQNWARLSVRSAGKLCSVCALRRAPGGRPGWGSWARRALPWLQAGAAALGWLSGSSGRAMLTSGGRVSSSQPSVGLLKVGLMEAFHPLTPFLSFDGATGRDSDHRERQVPHQPRRDPFHSRPRCGRPGQIRVHSEKPLRLHLQRHAAHHHR